MKVLSMSGSNRELRRDTARRLARELSRRRYTVALLSPEEENSLPAVPPGADALLTGCGIVWPQPLELSRYLPYLTEDFLLADQPLPDLPQLLCCGDSREAGAQWGVFTLAAAIAARDTPPPEPPFFSLEGGFSELTDHIIAVLPPLLPFPGANPCCGRCGEPDCPALLRRVIAGQATSDDCVLRAEQRVVVNLNGQPLPLVDFAQNIVRQTLRGLLSTLNGYEENARIEVLLDD